MFKLIKEKFSIPIFIFSSFCALAIAWLLYVLILTNLFATPIDEQYLLNKDNSTAEPSSADLFVTPAPDTQILKEPIINNTDPSIGSDKSKVKITIFSDYECKYCQDQEKMLRIILSKHKDQVRLIRKDFPEKDKNSKSYQSAIAARCAQSEGKFWPFHDELYLSKDLSETKYLEIAKKLKLSAKFKDCLSNSDIKKLIDDNIDEANALAITGIPFVYINNQEIMGQMNEEGLSKIIDVELAKKNYSK
jgi:protein-disulfide isomerase